VAGADRDLEAIEPAVLRGMTTPFPQLRPRCQLALEPAAVRCSGRFGSELARRLIAGNALHPTSHPGRSSARGFGLMLTAFAQRYGFRASRAARAVLTEARRRAPRAQCRVPLRASVSPALPHARTPARRRRHLELVGLLGRTERVPGSRHGEVDWTLDGPVAVGGDAARRSPVVHVGEEGSFVLFG